MQPFGLPPDDSEQGPELGSERRGAGNWPGTWFKSDATFDVVLYRDPDRNDSSESNAALAVEIGQENKIAESWVRIGGAVYVDVERLNREVFLPDLEKDTTADDSGFLECCDVVDEIKGLQLGRREKEEEIVVHNEEPRAEKKGNDGSCSCQ